MANPITFNSKSANIPLDVDQAKSKPLALKHRRPLAIFLGDPEQEFIKLGEELGFFCVVYNANSDPSHVVQAKVIIAQHMQYHFIHWIELINLAVDYGIPTVWVHPILPPGRWIWSFRYCLVGMDVKPIDLWRKVCQEAM